MTDQEMFALVAAVQNLCARYNIVLNVSASMYEVCIGNKPICQINDIQHLFHFLQGYHICHTEMEACKVNG